MANVKQLRRVGNSVGLILDQALLKQLDLTDESAVDVSVENSAIVIRPHRYATDGEAASAAERVWTRRRGLMRNLAKR